MKIEVVVVDYLNAQQGADLIHLLDGYAQDPMGGGAPLSATVKQNLVVTLSKTPHAFSLICYVDAEPAGLINCFEGFSTFSCQPLINIHDVVVGNKFRRMGVSQLMFNQVEVIARQKGCCKLTLEVLEGNQVAKNAYLKQGFAGYELSPAMGQALFWQKSI